MALYAPNRTQRSPALVGQGDSGNRGHQTRPSEITTPHSLVLHRKTSSSISLTVTHHNLNGNSPSHPRISRPRLSESRAQRRNDLQQARPSPETQIVPFHSWLSCFHNSVKMRWNRVVSEQTCFESRGTLNEGPSKEPGAVLGLVAPTVLKHVLIILQSPGEEMCSDWPHTQRGRDGVG
jgi:hypothetical protein